MVGLFDDGRLSHALSDSCKSQFTTFKVTQNSSFNFCYIISTSVLKSSFDPLLHYNVSLGKAAAIALMPIPTCNLSGAEVNTLLTLSVSQPELLSSGCLAKRLELEPRRLEPKDCNRGCKGESLE
jgi:hypothetical protein